MKVLQSLYRSNLSLLTDLYQLSMAYGYFRSGMQEQEAVFNLFFRKLPFKGGYAIACGLETISEFLEQFRFEEEDILYFKTLVGSDGSPLFSEDFLSYLKELKFTCDVEAIPEGTLVFPNEPLLRIRGPLIQCQLLETPLLNMMNFQTLIATKSARICQAAGDAPVLEFGLRRAQGIDGSITATRAAVVGGASATSNVLAGKLLNVPVKGTHAHSWVMSFEDEYTAFDTYAKAMPNNCVFLVDTYDTLEGVKNAIKVGKKLKESGHKMLGIRLDSGDLAYLSIEARKLLDAAGFEDAYIVASNDLDEYLIETLQRQDAKISVWGIGTKLVTSYDQPALGGVYKIAAILNSKKEWEHKVKLSEQPIKISTPGILQVRRFYKDGQFVADMIYDELTPMNETSVIVDPNNILRKKRIESQTEFEDLLTPIFENGKCVYTFPELLDIQKRVKDQLSGLHPSIRRFANPHEFPVGLEQNLFDLKMELIAKLRRANGQE